MLQARVGAFVAMLMAASAIAVLVKLVPIPYESALALAGLGAGLVTGPIELGLAHSLILFVFLPGLLFEAAYNLRWSILRSNLLAVLVLATIGVLLTTTVVGALGHWALGLALPLAMLFGSMVAPTDPVSVVAVFRRLGLPPRLLNLVEAESLANDGTGVVLFTIALGAAGAGTLALGPALLDFLRLALGGVALGLALGFAFSFLTSHLDDFQVEITFTAIAAYGGYLLGESVHVSGILVVVTAALVLGGVGKPRGMSERTQRAVEFFWGYVAFLLNSLLFLVIGLEVPWRELLQGGWVVAAAALIALLARAAAVYVLVGPLQLLGRGVSLRHQHLMVWGGLRGAIAVALVLSLADQGPQFRQVRALVYGVALISIVVQGITVGPLTRALVTRGRGPEARPAL